MQIVDALHKTRIHSKYSYNYGDLKADMANLRKDLDRIRTHCHFHVRKQPSLLEDLHIDELQRQLEDIRVQVKEGIKPHPNDKKLDHLPLVPGKKVKIINE